METTRNTTNLIRDIVFYYIKYYYDKHLEEHKISKLEDEKIEEFVDKLFNDNPKKMKKYIRDSLKKNQGKEYNSMVVENILLEMFDDIEFAKNRLINEISSYQEKDNDVSSN
jgi:hypothetical protein